MNSFLTNKSIILFALVSSALFLVFNPGIYSLIILVAFAVYYFANFNRYVIIYSSIIIMISFTRFGFAGSRDIITYALVLLLYFLFLKEYGFNFKEYPRLPC